MPSLSEFKNSFTGDLARPNRFLVEIPLPIKSFGEEIMDDSRTLMLRCENAQLPGRTFATTEQRTYGPIEKHPYLVTYNDIDLTFILSDDMGTKKIFDDWLEYINPQRTNNFGYPEELVDKNKLWHFISAGTAYIRYNRGFKWIQFDILAITLDESDKASFFLIEDVYL